MKARQVCRQRKGNEALNRRETLLRNLNDHLAAVWDQLFVDGGEESDALAAGLGIYGTVERRPFDSGTAVVQEE